MKPYESYPETIEWKGERLKLNLSYKAVLLALDVLDDEQLSIGDKCEIALEILVKDKHENDFYLLESILELIKPDTNDNSNSEKVIDLEKDFYYIISSFRQAYGIDIVRENIHYLEFIALLNGMPEGTKIVDVIRIRTMEVPEITQNNRKQVENILELKARYSLKDKDSFNDGLAKLFNALKGQVKK